MIRSRLFVMLFAGSLAACGGDDTAPVAPADPAAPTASGVFPAQGFVGRALRVELTGDGTAWDAQTTPSFGPDVHVVATTLASPTVLFADIEIAATAPAGLVDVSVTDPTHGQKVVLADAFAIESPLAIAVTGTLAQGSIVKVEIINRDPDNLFDATRDPEFADPFTHIAIATPDGVTATITAATQSRIAATLTIDVTAEPGELAVASGGVDGNAGGPIVTSSAGLLAIAARTPIALPSAPGTLPHLEPFTSQLYAFTRPAPPSFTRVDVLGPTAIYLPDTGRFADALITDFGRFDQFDDVAPTASPTVYLIVVAHDNGDDDGQIVLTGTDLAAVDEVATPHATEATSEPIGVPAMLANASLRSDQDIDFVSFAVGPDDLGHGVHVITSGDEETDLVVEVIAADAAGAETSLGASSDAAAGENFVSSAIPDGTAEVFVKFSPSPNFSLDHTAYDAAVFLEP